MGHAAQGIDLHWLASKRKVLSENVDTVNDLQHSAQKGEESRFSHGFLKELDK